MHVCRERERVILTLAEGASIEGGTCAAELVDPVHTSGIILAGGALTLVYICRQETWQKSDLITYI